MYEYLDRSRRASTKSLFCFLAYELIPDAHLTFLELNQGELDLNWRYRKSPWREGFEREYAKVRRRDAALADDVATIENRSCSTALARQKRYETLDSDDLDGTSPNEDEKVNDDPISSTTANEEPPPPPPSLGPIQPLPARHLSRSYIADHIKSVCSCQSFLFSRFLI